MRTYQLALLPTCALPGCQQLVTTVGEPLQRLPTSIRRRAATPTPPGRPHTAEEIDARDHHVRQAYQHQRDHISGPPRPDLLAVHRTPHLHRTSAGWECDHCQTVK